MEENRLTWGDGVRFGTGFTVGVTWSIMLMAIGWFVGKWAREWIGF